MQRMHIRSYSIDDNHDIRVTQWRRGDALDISRHYQEEAHDRRRTTPATTLDVFRQLDGRLTWALSPGGHDVESAQTMRELLGLFLDDCERDAADLRSL